jgi:hypothetical protein
MRIPEHQPFEVELLPDGIREAKAYLVFLPCLPAESRKILSVAYDASDHRSSFSH